MPPLRNPVERSSKSALCPRANPHYVHHKFNFAGSRHSIRAGPRRGRRASTRRGARLRHLRTGIVMESVGHPLRAGIFHVLHCATARRRANFGNRSAGPRIFVGIDAGDGTGCPGTRLRCRAECEYGFTRATMRSRNGNRNWLPSLRRKIGGRARRRRPRVATLERRRQSKLRRAGSSARRAISATCFPRRREFNVRMAVAQLARSGLHAYN